MSNDAVKYFASQPVILEALTPEMREVLGSEEITINRLPIRIGRQKLKANSPGLSLLERLKAAFGSVTQLVIPENGPNRFVSRQHMVIMPTRLGYELIDLGSSRGTIVDCVAIGGCKQKGRIPLRDGSIITIGSSNSPFIVRFKMSPEIGEYAGAVNALSAEYKQGFVGPKTFELELDQINEALKRGPNN